MDNEHMPRLHSDTRSAELAETLPDLPVVRGAHIAPNPRLEGYAPYCGAFNPGRDGAAGMGGPRAQRAAAADALRRWIFDPTAAGREKAVGQPGAEEAEVIAPDPEDELDCWPIQRRMREAGTWSPFFAGRPPAQPFDVKFLGSKRA